MSSQKSETVDGNKDSEDVDVDEANDTATVSGQALTNGNRDSSGCLSRVHSGDSLEDRSDNCDSGESAFNEKTDNTSSQAFGGARPKTTRNHDKNRVRNGESRTRNSESGVEIKVKACDTELYLGTRSSGDQDSSLQYNDISTIPRLESRPTPIDRSKRTSIPDISRDEIMDSDMTEDDCYIYTYKGGTAYLSADLPNSFFRLDSGSDGESLPGVAGAGQSNLSTGVAALIQDQLINSPHPQVRSFSPEQDFIEMDFDPGSESDGDSSSDSGQGRDGTDMEGEDREDERDGTLSSQDEGVREREVMSSPEVQHNIILEPIIVPNNNNFLTKNEEICINCDQDLPLLSPNTLPDPSHLHLHDLQEPHHPSSAPVLSPAEEVPVLMPRSKSLNSSLGDCLIMSSDPPVRIANLSLCGSRLLQREALIFGAEGETVTDSGQEPSDPDLDSALYKLSFVENIPSTLSQKAMIWTEKEAIRKQVTQLPNTSSCGATALLNVLLALELDVDLPKTAEAVQTKLRRPEAPLPDYLLSRSVAGCTHADLITAVHTTVPQVKARFFPFYNRTFQLAQWLAGWISRGLVPVLTLNVQKARLSSDGLIQDSWHHQMVWGVSGHDIYLVNPLEMVHERLIVQQISSPSELLIRRSDIVSRFTSSLDLSEINSLGQRWQDMNVLGQVVNLIREEKSAMREDTVTLTSHIRIPASYSSGVTLFCSDTNEEGVKLLRDAPDLHLLRK
eukprot:GFUD01019092.1.p1 GENE.GFUD01019092.1~~GFUD01019092.1.p1  ORF type:complete len:732 (+),score=200.13 GFUD01019092.1:118-2313(+)